MSKNISLKSISSIKPLAVKLYARFGRHIVFTVLFSVLLVYLLIVFKISTLAKAEPAPDQQVNISTSIPKIDKNAVNQIQSLEQNNTEIHSLFESARNNPFQE